MATFNNLLNELDVELHVPGYQYCGPGTQLAKKITRGDPGINKLDQFCKEHDLIYSKNRDDLDVRREADKVLAKKAIGRVFAKDAKLGERLVALGVAGVMKLKRKLGGGLRLAKKRSSEGGREKKSKAKQKIRRGKKMMRPKRSRIIPIPSKMGGVLPLFPRYAGGVGALASRTATVARAINQARTISDNRMKT